jgi:hypothetical protein
MSEAVVSASSSTPPTLPRLAFAAKCACFRRDQIVRHHAAGLAARRGGMLGNYRSATAEHDGAGIEAATIYQRPRQP